MAIFNYNGQSKSGGIYVIFNSYNWRIYVGSAKCFQVRWFQHYRSFSNNKHQNRFLQSDFNKCKELLGHDDFLEFHIVKPMPNSSKEERLLEEENLIKIHFDEGKQCYNLSKFAVSKEGFRDKNPEESSRKKSINNARYWLGKKRGPAWNKGLTAETDERIREQGKNHSLRMIGNKSHLGFKHSEETKKKWSELRRGKKWTEEMLKKRKETSMKRHETPKETENISI